MSGQRRQAGAVIWMVLLLLLPSGWWLLRAGLSAVDGGQVGILHTHRLLARAEQALLAYALQPLEQPLCDMNCPRPGDLPCPDRNNDGVAEGSCNTAATRLGRLPWKTLGLGDMRDASGERLWYAVSDDYKNNTRRLPLNTETAGTWSVRHASGALWDASLGQGVVAVLIAPMHPLTRSDGWVQQRSQGNTEVARHYLDMTLATDNAAPIEHQASGFVVAPASGHFNDVVWPITASHMHQQMQQHVLSELARSLRCTQAPCLTTVSPAAITDAGCLGYQTIAAGQCLPVATMVGRLPLNAQGQWPLAASHVLDGNARHHWFQQNGWREQVFFKVTSSQATLVVAGDPLPGQLRQTIADKAALTAYLEAGTLQRLHVFQLVGLDVSGNDRWQLLVMP